MIAVVKISIATAIVSTAATVVIAWATIVSMMAHKQMKESQEKAAKELAAFVKQQLEIAQEQAKGISENKDLLARMLRLELTVKEFGDRHNGFVEFDANLHERVQTLERSNSENHKQLNASFLSLQEDLSKQINATCAGLFGFEVGRAIRDKTPEEIEKFFRELSNRPTGNPEASQDRIE